MLRVRFKVQWGVCSPFSGWQIRSDSSPHTGGFSILLIGAVTPLNTSLIKHVSKRGKKTVCLRVCPDQKKTKRQAVDPLVGVSVLIRREQESLSRNRLVCVERAT